MENLESVEQNDYLNLENEKKLSNNKTLITFAKLNKYYSILFISPVFCMLGNYLTEYYIVLF